MRPSSRNTLSFELSRVIAERDAAQTHTTSLENQLKAAHQSVATAQGDTVQLQERLDGQAMEFAKEKTALQKQFNEYKDRLVTMSDDHRKAANGQREAEKSAAAAHAQAAAATKETTRLQRELQDAQDEARLLTEKLGEARGERDAIGRQTEEQRIQLNKTQASLAEAQQLVRQYVHKDKSLVQELLEERRGGASS